uniref:Solute carrier family 22 member 31 n=1 Tax=Malurus cyaneus samueli TaxID=2593467 RepID=A0A8C5WZU5_9PASS
VPCAALALGWVWGALGAEPPHRCPRHPPASCYRYPPGAPRPNGTGPCTRGWHYALPPPRADPSPPRPPQWDLVCSSRWKVPLEQTTHLLGWTLGSVTAGLACDRFGRRPTFLLSLALAVPVGLGVALAVDFLTVLVARLLFGAALAGAFLTLYVAREWDGGTHRGLGTEDAAGCGMVWVTALAAGHTATGGGQEDPAGCGRSEDNQPRGCGGGVTGPALPGVPSPGRAGDPVRGAPAAPVPLCLRHLRHQGHLEERRHPRFIGSGIRHCFTRNLVPHLPHFFSSHLALVGAEAVACLFVCLTAERFGRRAILLLCTVLTSISSLLLLALTQYLLELIVLTLSVVGTAASHAVTMLSIFFASEVLPTVIRGAGLGLVLGASFMGKAAAPITAIPNSRGFFLHHVVFASFAILAVLSIMLLPESQGRSLPQSLQDGESQRRPPLFRRPPREDHLPLLAPHAIPHDYSRLAASSKRMLRSPDPPREL